MLRRMEDRIRKLCQEAIAEQGPAKAKRLLSQLRVELRDYMKNLRERVAGYPVMKERRVGAPRLQIIQNQIIQKTRPHEKFSKSEK